MPTLEELTRGHEVALVNEQGRLDIIKFSFSQRTVNEWNILPVDCVGASSTLVLICLPYTLYLRRVGYMQIKTLDPR